MNNMDNLQSYDKVEYYQAHELSDEELRRYCNLKMETAQHNLEFIEKEIFAEGGWCKKIRNIYSTKALAK